MDRGTWWTEVYRVAKSWTQLKQLSTYTHTVLSAGNTRGKQT